jgi:hypothetical protein
MVTARTWLQKTVYDVGTKNVHHPTQNSPKKIYVQNFSSVARKKKMLFCQE